MPSGTRSTPVLPSSQSSRESSNFTMADSDLQDLSTHQLLVKLAQEMKDLKLELNGVSSKLDLVMDDSRVQGSKINLIGEDVQALKDDVKVLQIENTSLKMTNNQLKDKLTKLELYSRRDNLILNGVKQVDDEDCFAVATDAIKNDLAIADAENIKFDRCHRLPGKVKPQPLIVRFNCSADRDKVWKARFNLAKSKKMITLQEDFPEDIIARRNSLYPIMKERRN